MIVNRNNSQNYIWGGVCDGWILSQDHGLMVIEERMPAGSAEQKHFHKFARQFFYVTDGELTIEVGEQRYAVKAGEGITIEPTILHQARNDGDRDVRFIVISSPTSRGDRFEISDT